MSKNLVVLMYALSRYPTRVYTLIIVELILEVNNSFGDKVGFHTVLCSRPVKKA